MSMYCTIVGYIDCNKNTFRRYNKQQQKQKFNFVSVTNILIIDLIFFYRVVHKLIVIWMLYLN